MAGRRTLQTCHRKDNLTAVDEARSTLPRNHRGPGGAPLHVTPVLCRNRCTFIRIGDSALSSRVGGAANGQITTRNTRERPLQMSQRSGAAEGCIVLDRLCQTLTPTSSYSIMVYGTHNWCVLHLRSALYTSMCTPLLVPTFPPSCNIGHA